MFAPYSDNLKLNCNLFMLLAFLWQSLWCSHDPFDLLNKTGDNNPLSQERERDRRVVDKHGHFLFYFYILCDKI